MGEGGSQRHPIEHRDIDPRDSHRHFFERLGLFPSGVGQSNDTQSKKFVLFILIRHCDRSVLGLLFPRPEAGARILGRSHRPVKFHLRGFSCRDFP